MSEKPPINPSYVPPSQNNDDENDKEIKITEREKSRTGEYMEYQGTIITKKAYEEMMKAKREGTWPDDRK